MTAVLDYLKFIDICWNVYVPRKGLNNPDSFWDVCGELTFVVQRRKFRPVTEILIFLCDIKINLEFHIYLLYHM